MKYIFIPVFYCLSSHVFVFEDDIEISLACLTKLQNLHLLHVPWENLDVFTGRRKELIVEELYEQLVVQHRGGWCHELNGLFAWLLKTLGFEVKIVSAHFCNPESGKFEGDFGHMALIVRLAGQEYLADVCLGSAAGGGGQCSAKGKLQAGPV